MAAGKRGTALILFIDELQYVEERELATLITARHRARQNERPIALVAAGWLQLAGLMGKARFYAERLFLFTSIGALDCEAASATIVHPIQAEGCSIESEAVSKILAVTQDYPYFLQEWSKQCWDVAEQCPITAEDVDLAYPTAVAKEMIYTSVYGQTAYTVPLFDAFMR